MIINLYKVLIITYIQSIRYFRTTITQIKLERHLIFLGLVSGSTSTNSCWFESSVLQHVHLSWATVYQENIKPCCESLIGCRWCHMFKRSSLRKLKAIKRRYETRTQWPACWRSAGSNRANTPTATGHRERAQPCDKTTGRRLRFKGQQTRYSS